MSAFDDAIKGFHPIFGNQEHIQLIKRIGELKVMLKHPVNSKLYRERVRMREESIIHSINQSKSV